LGVLFTASQYFEYLHAPFSIADGIYGSLFYMMTGFHGIHVIIGTIFLIVAFFRLRIGHFTKEHHIGLEIAA
jgi:cytochrome c oxidase subunit 3